MLKGKLSVIIYESTSLLPSSRPDLAIFFLLWGTQIDISNAALLMLNVFISLSKLADFLVHSE